jgi:hypothetical protein
MTSQVGVFAQEYEGQINLPAFLIQSTEWGSTEICHIHLKSQVAIQKALCKMEFNDKLNPKTKHLCSCYEIKTPWCYISMVTHCSTATVEFFLIIMSLFTNACLLQAIAVKYCFWFESMSSGVTDCSWRVFYSADAV